MPAVFGGRCGGACKEVGGAIQRLSICKAVQAYTERETTAFLPGSRVRSSALDARSNMWEKRVGRWGKEKVGTEK